MFPFCYVIDNNLKPITPTGRASHFYNSYVDAVPCSFNNNSFPLQLNRYR
tara:strand:- start:2024 stop:2173 length:150 start_codon:yes stop_codon:yes gene_type:complete